MSEVNPFGTTLAMLIHPGGTEIGDLEHASIPYVVVHDLASYANNDHRHLGTCQGECVGPRSGLHTLWSSGYWFMSAEDS